MAETSREATVGELHKH